MTWHQKPRNKFCLKKKKKSNFLSCWSALQKKKKKAQQLLKKQFACSQFAPGRSSRSHLDAHLEDAPQYTEIQNVAGSNGGKKKKITK